LDRTSVPFYFILNLQLLSLIHMWTGMCFSECGSDPGQHSFLKAFWNHFLWLTLWGLSVWVILHVWFSGRELLTNLGVGWKDNTKSRFKLIDEEVWIALVYLRLEPGGIFCATFFSVWLLYIADDTFISWENNSYSGSSIFNSLQHDTPVKYCHLSLITLLAQKINNWTYFDVLEILKFTLMKVGAHFSTYVVVA
jgi:hypothetical protein